MTGRRPVLAGLALAMLGGTRAFAEQAATPVPAGEPFGMIGKLQAKPGQRKALLAVLSEGSAAMPGCLAYVVAEDLAEPDAIWVTELWENKAAHDASLALPGVRAAIAKGRPLIAGFALSAQTRPVLSGMEE